MKEFVVKFPLGTPLEPLCRKAEELGYKRVTENVTGCLDCICFYCDGDFGIYNHPCGSTNPITLETFMKMNKLTNKYVKVPHNTALKEAVLKHAKDLGLGPLDSNGTNNDRLEFFRYSEGNEDWSFYSSVCRESSIPIYDFFALTKEDITPKPQQTRLSVEEIKKKLGIEGDLIVEE